MSSKDSYISFTPRNGHMDKYVGEHDPLVKGPQSTRRRSMIWSLELAELSIVPWVVFFMTALMFLFAYHEAKLLVWVLTIVIGFLACASLCAGFSFSNRFLIALSFLCLCSVISAACVGLWFDGTYLDYYWKLKDGAEYKNVDPYGRQQTSDAGVMHFKDGTFVDDLRTVGFVVDGNIYCVAPVANQKADLSQININEVSYWATGINCCEKRSNFNCGASHHIGAHSAVIANTDGNDLENFASAIDEANSYYGLTFPSDRQMQLLRFVDDTKEALSSEFSNVAVSSIVLIGLDFCVSVAMAVLLMEFFPKLQHSLLHRGRGTSYPSYPSYEMTK
mmetsp:Transcript_103131/g.188233  ORF Transcript_103131/g.188233 Transcript_103131/m.188233 type:complete len:334 (-) Transcript_103131:78-1079(-)